MPVLKGKASAEEFGGLYCISDAVEEDQEFWRWRIAGLPVLLDEKGEVHEATHGVLHLANNQVDVWAVIRPPDYCNLPGQNLKCVHYIGQDGRWQRGGHNHEGDGAWD